MKVIGISGELYCSLLHLFILYSVDSRNFQVYVIWFTLILDDVYFGNSAFGILIADVLMMFLGMQKLNTIFNL